MKHTIHVTGTRCKLTLHTPRSDYKNKSHRTPEGRWLEDQERLDLRIAEVEKALAKCTGKHRAIKIKTADSRKFPLYGSAMTTARYVQRYFELNNTLIHSSDCFEPLSTRPQEWPQEPLYEEIEEDQGDTVSYDFGASESLPAWLTAGVPPEWIKD